MSSRKKVPPTPVSYHEWVIMEARLFAFEQRKSLVKGGQKQAGRLTKDERTELALLKKRCKSCDPMEYALLHHCEAIAGGVVIPEKERHAVREALSAAYRVSDLDDDDNVSTSFENALAALGVLKADLPKHFDEEDE